MCSSDLAQRRACIHRNRAILTPVQGVLCIHFVWIVYAAFVCHAKLLRVYLNISTRATPLCPLCNSLPLSISPLTLMHAPTPCVSYFSFAVFGFFLVPHGRLRAPQARGSLDARGDLHATSGVTHYVGFRLSFHSPSAYLNIDNAAITAVSVLNTPSPNEVS